jgi:hypothetical protein
VGPRHWEGRTHGIRRLRHSQGTYTKDVPIFNTGLLLLDSLPFINAGEITDIVVNQILDPVLCGSVNPDPGKPTCKLSEKFMVLKEEDFVLLSRRRVAYVLFSTLRKESAFSLVGSRIRVTLMRIRIQFFT